MVRVLEEQCEVREEKVEVKDESNGKGDGEAKTKTVVEVKARTGGNVMQNPSDPDATYDGHKGPGYQVQISETCGESNDVQLITGVEVEGAHKSDQDALDPMLDQLDEHGRGPEVMYADGGYGRDENAVSTDRRDVDLQSPVGGTTPQNGQNKNDLTVDDFVIDEASEIVERCPNGCKPRSSTHDADAGKTTTVMRSSDCAGCEFGSQCPVSKTAGRFILRHTPTQRRLAARRAEQATDAFKENYAIRAGGESVNSGLKRKTGMGRLRTRGQPRVSMAVLFRCAGWNVMRALTALQKRGIRDFVAAATLIHRIINDFRPHQFAASGLTSGPPPIFRQFSPAPVLTAA